MSVDVSTNESYRIRVTRQCQARPCPHPEPVACKVDRAREACSEALAELAGMDLSNAPGTDPRRTYTFWEGMLETHLGYLLLTLEEQDAATR